MLGWFFCVVFFFFFKQKTAYELGVRLVGSEMCIRDSLHLSLFQDPFLSSSNCLTHRTSFGVVTLMFSLDPSTRLTRPPALSTKEESSVAESRNSSSCPYAERIDVPRKIWGVWAHHTRDLSSVSRITPSPSTNLTVSVLGTAITTPSNPSSPQSSSNPASISPWESRGRAPSWMLIISGTPCSTSACTPARTDSARSAPPPTTWVTLGKESATISLRQKSTSSAFTTTTIAST